jgi:hypothetical protein
MVRCTRATASGKEGRKEGGAQTVFLNNVESVEGHGDVDSAQDELHKNRVVNAGRVEYGGAVVEEIVDASPLLEEVDADTEEGTVENLGDIGLGAEAFQPATGADLLFLLEDLPHLVDIVLDQGVLQVVLEASKAAKGQTGVVPATAGGEPTGRLGDNHDTKAERQREKDSEADDNTLSHRSSVSTACQEGGWEHG